MVGNMLIIAKLKNTKVYHAFTNHLGGNKEMQKHIIELTRERDDLGLKISKLKKFMKSDDFYNLDKDDQERLKAQKSVMKTYKHILNERIYWED